jgi:hypothetical protein
MEQKDALKIAAIVGTLGVTGLVAWLYRDRNSTSSKQSSGPRHWYRTSYPTDWAGWAQQLPEAGGVP